MPKPNATVTYARNVRANRAVERRPVPPVLLPQVRVFGVIACIWKTDFERNGDVSPSDPSSLLYCAVLASETRDH